MLLVPVGKDPDDLARFAARRHDLETLRAAGTPVVFELSETLATPEAVLRTATVLRLHGLAVALRIDASARPTDGALLRLADIVRVQPATTDADETFDARPLWPDLGRHQPTLVVDDVRSAAHADRLRRNGIKLAQGLWVDHLVSMQRERDTTGSMHADRTITHPTVLSDAEERRRRRVLAELGPFEMRPPQALEHLARTAARICASPIGTVVVVDELQERHLSLVRPDHERQRISFELPRAGGLCEAALAGLGPFAVENAAADPRFQEHPLVAGEIAVRSFAGAPITLAEGVTLGVVAAMDHRARSFDVGHLSALRALAVLAARELEVWRQRPPDGCGQWEVSQPA